jgi:hypothetical protein
MNKQKYQKGSIHLVIIIVLIVALLGILGFVYWQNFLQPKSTTKSNNSTSTSTPTPQTNSPTTTPPTVVEDINTLKINEWNIKGIYKGSHPIKYTIEDGGYYHTKYYATFTSDDLNGACSGWSVGDIVQLTGDLKVKSVFPGLGYLSDDRTVAEEYAVDKVSGWMPHKHIGDYYYVYVSPQQGCDQTENDSNKDISIQATSDVSEFFDSLEAY